MNNIKDFENEVEHLETTQRHDLAVHLYLTHLLHRVNPLFPLEKWALWPQKTVIDPSVLEDFEDGLLGLQNDYNESDVQLNSQDIPQTHVEGSNNASESDSGVDSDFKTLFFRPTAGAVRLRKLHRRKLHAKASLVNEMHALVQKRIAQKLASKHPHLATTPIDADLPVLRHMALQMANRMGRVVEKIKQQRNMAKLSSGDKQYLEPATYRRFYKQNWQDVVTADLRSDDRSSLVDVKRLRELYTKCRKLFHEVQYKYEYDPAEYGDDESVPDFELTEHLEAIQKDSEYGLLPLDALRILRDRKKLEALKEELFINLWNQAGEARQLSYKREDNPGYGGDPALTEMEEEVTKALYKNGLRPDDFELPFKM